MKEHYENKYREFEEKIHPLKLFGLNLLPDPPKKILDVGCGTGIISKILKTRGYEVTGIDISENAIKKAKDRDINAYVEDISQPIRFDDDFFDIIWCSEVLEHVVDPLFTLGEFYRVLKPKGNLLLTTPNSAFLIRRILHLCGHTCTTIQNYTHVRFYNYKLLKELLWKTNFGIIRCIGYTKNPINKEKGIAINKLVNLLGNNFIIFSQVKTRARETSVELKV